MPDDRDNLYLRVPSDERWIFRSSGQWILQTEGQRPREPAWAITDEQGFTHWLSPPQMRQHPMPELKDVTRDDDAPPTAP